MAVYFICSLRCVILNAFLFFIFSPVEQFATEAAITILRIDDMIKLVKDESQNEEN